MEVRYEFLRSLVLPVRGLLALGEVESNGETLLYVQVHPPARAQATDARLRGVRDAIVLLSLLSRADPAGIEYVLREYCSCDATTLRGAFTRDKELHLERFKLWVEGSQQLSWEAVSFAQLFSRLDATSTDDFDAAVRMIAASSTPAIEEFAVCIVLKVGIFSGASYEMSDPNLKALLVLHRQNRGWNWAVNVGQCTPSPRCSFAIESVELCADTGWSTDEILAQIGDLVACGGLTISNLSQIVGLDEDSDILRDPRWAGHFFQRLYCGGGRPSNSFGVIENSSYIVSTSYVDTLLPRLCTALAEARTTKGVTLVMEFLESIDIGRSARLWQWLAFGLFSKHARTWSSVTQVAFENFMLGHADVRAIATLLAAEDPLEFLLNQTRVQNNGRDITLQQGIGSCRRLLLRKGVPLKIVSMHANENILSEAEGFILQTDAAGVILLDERESDQDNAIALIPGYGLCQIARGALREVDCSAQPNAEGHGSLKSLSIKVSNQPDLVDGLMAFLDLVGTSLTELKLCFPHHLPVPASFDIEHALRSCPRLESLAIEGVQIDAAIFLETYYELGMQIKELHCSFTDSIVIVNELGGKSSLLARSLKSLYLQCQIADANSTEYAVDIVRTVALLNCPSYTQLGIPSFMFREVTRREGYCIKRSVPAPREPFPLSCRLAFLSVLDRNLPRLCDQTATRIFEFAAERACRHIEIVRFFV